MITIKLALDWTPNANHVGFYVAQELGLYKKAGIDLKIIHAGQDNYATTPAKKVELGLVHMALCPLESVMSYRTKSNPFPLKAIATLFKEDLSAIVCKKDGTIKTPKDLDGKTYASYNARYEDAIVQQMIINDHGKGDIKLVYPEKLGIWETIENNTIDATWIFTNWEGVQANESGLELEYFKLKDYGIPYSYSPVMVVDETTITENSKIYKNFLHITKAGYLHAQQYPADAAAILKSQVPIKDQHMDLEKSINLTCKAIGLKEDWGIMEPQRVELFLKWLQDHQLENHQLNSNSLFTNELLNN